MGNELVLFGVLGVSHEEGGAFAEHYPQHHRVVVRATSPIETGAWREHLNGGAAVALGTVTELAARSHRGTAPAQRREQARELAVWALGFGETAVPYLVDFDPLEHGHPPEVVIRMRMTEHRDVDAPAS